MGIGLELAEARILFELAQRDTSEATDLRRTAGFILDNEARQHSFGKDLVEQNWSRRSQRRDQSDDLCRPAPRR